MDKEIIFFDGHCNLCNSSVDLILKFDKKQKFSFASLQGETAKKYLFNEKEIPTSFDSVILYRRGISYEKSDAALEILKDFSYIGFFGYLLYLFPKFLRDEIYMFISRNRFKFFGKRDTCRMPSPEERARFLD